MSLVLYFYPSYQRFYKTLGKKQRQTAGKIIEALEVYYGNGCDLAKTKSQLGLPRFFYKQLRKPYYEAGIESHLRVLITNENEKCIATLVGNHDDIRKFLARN